MTSSSPAQDENWGWLRALWNGGWFLGLLLVATIIFVYQPVWHAGFIWDDDAHVTKPALRSLGGLASIWIRLGATQQYYPLVHSVFWVEHRLWGDSTVGYHLTNILLHAFSALLLVKILRQLKIPGAWLAAAIFALHPVQVESVSWISELKNTLSGAFYLGSALAYLDLIETEAEGIMRWLWDCSCWVCCRKPSLRPCPRRCWWFSGGNAGRYPGSRTCCR